MSPAPGPLPALSPVPVPSLEQMVAASPGKTPISLLQEYGTRLGRTPGYDLLKAEGQAHQPNFTFRVTLGDISCTGGTPGPPGNPHTHPGPPVPLLSPWGHHLHQGDPKPH